MHDLRLAFRTLFARPAFSAVAILTLALGIGANAAVFTVFHAVLLAPLPYTDPSAVVILNEQTPQFPTLSVTRLQLRGLARARQIVFGHRGLSRHQHDSVRCRRSRAGPGQDDLGEPAAASRHRQSSAAAASATRKTVPAPKESQSSARRSRTAGSPMCNRSVARCNSTTVRTPSSESCRRPSSCSSLPTCMSRSDRGPSTLPDDRGWHPGIFPVARLEGGVSLEQARVEMETIALQLESEHRDSNHECSRARHQGAGSAGRRTFDRHC